MHHFVDGFLFGMFLDLVGCLYGVLGCNIVSCLLIEYHRCGSNPRAVAST